MPAAQAQEVFINEIHYDNAGTDQGEAVEIAGPAGTDLAGWSLVLYNGNGGAVYDSREIGAVIPNQQNGYGTVAVEYTTTNSSIQNGSPDGIALVSDQGEVIQFLSYEGSFTAGDGPAAGLTSSDIGVSESSGTDAGFSLQLIGTGTTYEAFTWTEPREGSFGSVNTGQAFESDTPQVPRFVINEIDYAQPGTDAAEFLELYNAGTASVDLDPYTVELVNGSDSAVYGTIDLPAAILAPGEYFVVCGDARNVVGCDLDVEPNTNLLQNGAPDAIGLVLEGVLIDALSYEGSVPGYTEGTGTTAADPNAEHVSLSRFPDGTDTGNNAADFSLRCGSPGAPNAENSANCPSTRPASEAQTVFIHDVQGSGGVSPLEGQTVTIEGVVIGDFQEGDGDAFDSDLGGFFVQEEVGDVDGDPETSEGVFVFTKNASTSVPDVSHGQIVRVTGKVDEFFDLTRLTEVSSVEIVGGGDAPTPVDVRLPISSRDALERYEGMLVRFPQAFVISEYFNFDRFGEVVLALPPEGLDRLYQPTSYAEPEEAAAAEEANRLRKIVLDDGRTEQNPDPARHPNGEVFDLSNRFRGGDVVENATGVLSYGFGAYRIQPTRGAGYTKANPRPEAPTDVVGSLRVASFNVLNYFNGNGTGGGFPTTRGADTPEELERQTAKIISVIARLDAAIIGLIEVENDPAGERSALDDLVDALDAEVGEGTYDYVRTGVIGTDEIKVGLLYKPEVVARAGDYAVLDAPSFTDPNNLGQQKNRPALAQTFREKTTGGVFTVVVNHLKSKGSPCGEGDDSPVQGSCNGTRADAADVLVDWLAGDPTGSGDPDYLIIGDLNAYDEEDPIDQIREGADDVLGTADDYVDLVEQYGGELAYSYVFDGEFGYLDYALAIHSLAEQVTGATEWHINADEPDILDYDTSFKKDAQDALYEPNPYRASDHDPVLVGLSLGRRAGDQTPPRCELMPVESGPPTTLNVVVQDPESGLASITTTRLQNAEAYVGGVGPVGEGKVVHLAGAPTGRVEVTAEKLDEGGEATLALEAQNGAGLVTACDPIVATIPAEVPETYGLSANYPNPFNPTTYIAFRLPEASDVVRLVVYDAIGREVDVLVRGAMQAGRYEVEWDGRDAAGRVLPSGMYLYRIEAGTFTQVRQMVLLK